MPEITAAQRHKLNRDPIRDPHIALFEFQEDGSSTIHRAAVNTEDVVWRGETYVRRQIEVKFPNSGTGETRATLTTSNIDRILGRALDAAKRRINVRMILVDHSDLDGEPLVDTKNLLVVPNASGMTDLTVDLGVRASQQEPVPARPTSQAAFPGVWLA